MLEAGNLSLADSLQLKNLAQLCPFVDGAVVYQARSLYNVAFGCNEVFANSCYTLAASAARTTTSSPLQKAENTAFAAEIYPMPCKDVLNVKTNAQNCQTQVYNMFGELVVESTNTHISLQLPAGMYIVTLTNLNSHEKINKKLVVVD